MEKEHIKKIDISKSNDSRGNACKLSCAEIVENLRLSFSVDEIFFSTSKKDVIRGMHFQTEETAQSKIISVLQGEIVDVIIDMRVKSKEFGKIYEYAISDKSEFAIYIPKGFAHGFKAIKGNTILSYIMEGKQNRTSERGIRWDSFGYDWKIKEPILSERDKKLPTYEQVIRNMKG